MNTVAGHWLVSTPGFFADIYLVLYDERGTGFFGQAVGMNST